MGERIPLWLDCDPGHDDAFAILLAAHHPSLQLLGISTVHGNASLDRTTDNARRVLAAIGRLDVPVYAGHRRPFCRSAVHAPDIHGTSGIDGTDLLPPVTAPAAGKHNAIEAARDAILSTPKDTAWVVTTGSLTNVAILFAAYPDVSTWIKGLSVMGGAIGGGFSDAPLGKVEGEGERLGNVTKWAEFNIYCDPESARSIFSNPALTSKTTLIPLDLTHQVLATAEVQTLLLYGPRTLATSLAGSSSSPPSGLPLRRLLHDLLTFFATTYADVFGLVAGPPLHDPVAVAVLLWKSVTPQISFADAEGERWIVEVVTDGHHGDHGAQTGRVLAQKVETSQTPAQGNMEAAGAGESQTHPRPGITIPRSVDVSTFWTVLEECVSRAEQHLVQHGAPWPTPLSAPVPASEDSGAAGSVREKGVR